MINKDKNKIIINPNLDKVKSLNWFAGINIYTIFYYYYHYLMISYK